MIGDRPFEATSVLSPCVSICKMDSITGLCEGCLRTIDEIAQWSQMNDEQKRQVLVQLQLRQPGGRNQC